jgi:hypothetical protein
VHANTPLGDAALLPPQGDGAALVSAGSALARSLSEGARFVAQAPFRTAARVLTRTRPVPLLARADGRDQYYDAGDAAFELDEELVRANGALARRLRVD